VLGLGQDVLPQLLWFKKKPTAAALEPNQIFCNWILHSTMENYQMFESMSSHTATDQNSQKAIAVICRFVKSFQAKTTFQLSETIVENGPNLAQSSACRCCTDIIILNGKIDSNQINYFFSNIQMAAFRP
jgi:hypothetical protein